MNHSFNIDIAAEYGIEEAIIINNLDFWLAHNKANKSNFNDGTYWTFNSARAFSELFPYMSAAKIRRVLNGLEEKGVIITGNYNKINYDRTKWYSLSDAFCRNNKSILHFCRMEVTEMENGNDESVTPIPDINTIIKPIKTKDIRHKYGEFKNVLLSDPNYKELQFLTHDIEGYIKRLDEYIESSGRKYKNHYLTIRNWYNKDSKKSNPKTGSTNYSEGW